MTLVLGALLTVFIVFLFLNSWRSTVITGLTLPVSVISSFIVMYFLNMTLNMLTLMALSLAIGLLIDDAIVVRENIVRHLEHGEDHFEAARKGTDEIGLAVLATSMSIIAVFVPVAFMKGVAGRFFYQFGLTVAFAVLVSLFVSFTLDPMLSSRWHDPDILRQGKRSWWHRPLDAFNEWFERMADGYKRVIGWALDHRGERLAHRGRGVRGRRRGPRPAADRVHVADRPGRVRRQVPERAGRLHGGDARPPRRGAEGPLGVEGGPVHLRLDWRGRLGHRARRDGVRQARAQGRARRGR